VAQTAKQRGLGIEPQNELVATAAAPSGCGWLWSSDKVCEEIPGWKRGAIPATFLLHLMVKFELFADKGNPTV
jgi:hypothetical protein